MNQAVTIVVCAGLTKPLRPDSFGGYFCVMCKAPLQATRLGRKHIEDGAGLAVCNSCGFVAFAAASVADKVDGVEIGPEAMKVIEQSEIDKAARS